MKKTLFIGNLILAILLFFVTVSLLILKLPIIGTFGFQSMPADTGWHYEDGSPAMLSDLQFISDRTTISRTINAGSVTSSGLCFISQTADFSVYLNDDLIYDYRPELDSIYGYTYGIYLHTIEIPHFTETAELTIEATVPSGGQNWAGFQDAEFSDSFRYLFTHITSDYLKFFISFMTLIAGFAIMVLGLIFNSYREQKLEMLSLGSFAMSLSLWILSSSYFIGLIVDNPAYIRLINHMALILFPVLGVTFVSCLIKQPRNKSLIFMLFYTFANLIYQFAMQISGYNDIHNLLLLSHIGFLCSICLAIYLIIRYGKIIKKTKRQTFLLQVAFLILIASGLLDLISYYRVHLHDFARYSRFGFLIFVILLFYYEINEFFIVSKNYHEIEIMRRLAHEDGLTGLDNRLAFNEFEDELSLRKTGNGLIIQFDIDNLKKINDTCGHMEGDAIIKAFASILADSFGQYGKVFRIGGDEFISILVSESDTLASLSDKCVKQMKEAIAQYNEEHHPQIPLAASYGMAECDFTTDDLREKEIAADTKMYEYKHKSHSGNDAEQKEEVNRL